MMIDVFFGVVLTLTYSSDADAVNQDGFLLRKHTKKINKYELIVALDNKTKNLHLPTVSAIFSPIPIL